MIRVMIIRALVLALVTLNLLHGQSLEGNTWIVGTRASEPYSGYGGATTCFNSNWPSIDTLSLECDLSGQAMYCNDEGLLQLFSNGCRIYNSEGRMIVNGDSISYTPLWRNCPEYDAITAQGVIFLKWPLSLTKVVFFHIRIFDN